MTYSESGINQLLRRLGFVYKKPKLIPGKANAEQQFGFVEAYLKLRETKKPQDRIYFIPSGAQVDATHPHHNPIAGYDWIKRGLTHEIRSNTGRQRLNINGVTMGHDLSAVVRYGDTINAQSTIQLFQRQKPGGRTHSYHLR